MTKQYPQRGSRPFRPFLHALALLGSALLGWSAHWCVSKPPFDHAPVMLDQPSHPARIRVALVKIIDGDTIKVRWRGKVESVRMLCINTPERGAAGATEATMHLRRLIDNATDVELEFETKGMIERDRYNRLLAYVWQNGRNLNIEMVRSGHTPFWTRYGAGKYATEFTNAQNEHRKIVSYKGKRRNDG